MILFFLLFADLKNAVKLRKSVGTEILISIIPQIDLQKHERVRSVLTASLAPDVGILGSFILSKYIAVYLIETAEKGL